MKPGRIVYLSDYFGAGGAETGGAGIAALQSYEAVRAQAADASLVSGYYLPAGWEGRTDATRLGGADLRAGAALKALGAIYNPRAARRVKAALSRFDPASTVVVLHQWTRWLSPSAIAQLAPFRLMVYMHDYFWACPTGAYYDFKAAAPCTRAPLSASCLIADCDRGGRGPKAVRVARGAVKALVAGGSPDRRLFLSISALGRRTAEGLLPKEAHALVHNPLAIPPQAAGGAQACAYDVGYFGRLEVEKGVADLVRVLKATGRRGVFVGSGALGAQIAATLGPQALVEWADHADALALMRRCRAVALPSRWTETWGLVVPEALAMGRPVVVSRRAGSAELVDRFGGGATFDPGAPGGLEAAIDAVLDNDLSDAGAARAAVGVREALSPRAHGGRIIDLAGERWGLDLRRAPRSGREAAGPRAAT